MVTRGIELLEKMSFGEDKVFLNASCPQEALSIVDAETERLTQFLQNLGFSELVIRNSGLPRDLTILASSKVEETEQKLTVTTYKLSLPLLREMASLTEDDKPRGIITSDNIQVWINPAAKRLFQLANISDGIGRDTTKDWYAPDLEQKNRLIQQTSDGDGFEISGHIKIGDQWKLMTTNYIRVGEFLTAATLDTATVNTPNLAC